MILLGILASPLAIVSASAEAPAPAGAPCFQVIEGQADVPPAAPMLVDRCTGASFVLASARRGGKSTFEWVPIGKAGSGPPAEVAAPSAPSPTAAPRARTAGKTGCFTYNGRSYCP